MIQKAFNVCPKTFPTSHETLANHLGGGVVVDCSVLGTPDVKSLELRQLATVCRLGGERAPQAVLRPSLKLGHPFLHLSPIWFWLQGKTPLSAKPRIKWTSPALLSQPHPQAKPRQSGVCVCWGGDTGPLEDFTSNLLWIQPSL